MIPVGKYNHTKPSPTGLVMTDPLLHLGCFHWSYFLMFWSYFISLKSVCTSLWYSGVSSGNVLLLKVSVSCLIDCGPLPAETFNRPLVGV